MDERTTEALLKLHAIAEKHLVENSVSKTSERRAPVYPSLFYYSAQAGKDVRPIIDRLSAGPVKIDCFKLGLSPTTLYRKLGQAWLWLIDNSPEQEERELLFLLRKRCRIVPAQKRYVYVFQDPNFGVSLTDATESIGDLELNTLLHGAGTTETQTEPVLDAELVETERLLESHSTTDWTLDIENWLKEATEGIPALDRIGLNLGELERDTIRVLHEPFKDRIALVRLNLAGYRMIYNPTMAKDLHSK